MRARTFLDLFCGCGGFTLGMLRSGLRCLAAIDIDTPKSRTKFWVEKLESNVMRDRRVNRELAKLGWHVVTVWECELGAPDRLSKRLEVKLNERHQMRKSHLAGRARTLGHSKSAPRVKSGGKRGGG